MTLSILHLSCLQNRYHVNSAAMFQCRSVCLDQHHLNHLLCKDFGDHFSCCRAAEEQEALRLFSLQVFLNKFSFSQDRTYDGWSFALRAPLLVPSAEHQSQVFNDISPFNN